MIEEFCRVSGLDDETKRLLLALPYDEEAEKRAVGYVRERDRKALLALCNETGLRYGCLYPLRLFAAAMDETARFFPDEETLSETLGDISIWVGNYRSEHHVTGFDRSRWLVNHITGYIISYGRLQAETCQAPFDFASVQKGDGVLALHIPQGGRLDKEAVDESLERIRNAYDEEYALIDSWLLNPELRSVLKDDSNILSFARRFELLPSSVTDEGQMIDRVFGWGLKRDDVLKGKWTTSLQKGIRKKMEEGAFFGKRQGYMKLH
jgi:hypothetical protein